MSASASASASAWAGPAEHWQRPSNELAVVLGQSQVIGEADGVVLAVGALRVYSSGVGLDLIVRVRGGEDGRLRLHEAVFGHGHNGALSLAERLLLGIEYADGRRASNLGDAPFGPAGDDEDGAPILAISGGSGGGQAFDQEFWLSPLPPPGPLAVICQWIAAGIPETRTVLDGAAVAEAAGRVRQLWPWEPEQHEEQSGLPPERPTTGWFAERGPGLPS